MSVPEHDPILDRLAEELHLAELRRERIVEKLEEDATERRRARFVSLVALAAALVLGVLDSVGLLFIYRSAASAGAAARSSRDNGGQIQATLNRVSDLASIVDPTSARAKAAASLSAQARQKLIEELECRVRRALAGQPPVAPNQSCIPS